MWRMWLRPVPHYAGLFAISDVRSREFLQRGCGPSDDLTCHIASAHSSNCAKGAAWFNWIDATRGGVNFGGLACFFHRRRSCLSQLKARCVAFAVDDVSGFVCLVVLERDGSATNPAETSRTKEVGLGDCMEVSLRAVVNQAAQETECPNGHGCTMCNLIVKV